MSWWLVKFDFGEFPSGSLGFLWQGDMLKFLKKKVKNYSRGVFGSLPNFVIMYLSIIY